MRIEQSSWTVRSVVVSIQDGVITKYFYKSSHKYLESGGWVELDLYRNSSFARTHQVFQTEISAEKPVNR